ncbi:MAG: hypothetical protein COT17_05815 [Elusimicrobia bacterium CG08_land_8_20_14_0_20_51_18]|nr:MAG: hypothetical protein COT17_05815 [Elusimicrobia bacterium CG08_land_8_20_14_0_20_51_18]
MHGAQSSNAVSTLVSRDASGNFAAGTITATLDGNATNVTGTVAIANGGTGANTAANARTALDVPQNVGALANKIACWKDTNTLSYCTAIDTTTANGDCTCN